MTDDDSKPGENGRDSALRDRKGRFLPGSPAKAGPGRPRGVSAIVLERTRQGEELIEVLLSIARDKMAKQSDRLRAVELLSDRAFGKSAETIVTATVDAG